MLSIAPYSFHKVRTIAYPKDVTSHYFTASKAAKSHELIDINVQVRGLDLQLLSAPQVFSSHRLDLGTKVLLMQLPEPVSTGRFLDLGCGWGPIACVLASLRPDAQVWAVDVNDRALDLTQRNAAKLRLKNLQTSSEESAYREAVENDTRFDLIVSNPPVRIGKGPMQDLTKRWLDRLSDDGVAYLVMAKNLGADSYINWLNQAGFAARKAHSKKGYRIIEVKLAHS